MAGNPREAKIEARLAARVAAEIEDDDVEDEDEEADEDEDALVEAGEERTANPRDGFSIAACT